MVKTLAIIGMGLIGSSIARAAREYHACSKIIVSDISQSVCDKVLELQIADFVTSDVAEAVRDADLVILCVPPSRFASVGEAISGSLKAGAIVSDVGSVKGSVVTQLTPFMRDDVHLIPAHPVAGTEHSGPESGFASLFQGRWCIITPPEQVAAEPLAVLTAFWEKIGAKIELMTPEHHDLVLAITSHVPHLIAYNIVGTASDLEKVTEGEVIKFSAGGFRDFTRIAASDPTMWRDVFLHNKEAVIEMLGRFTEDLIALQRAIRWDDGDTLFELFTKTRAIRRSIITEKQDTDAADFGRKH
jgi:cyclohexadieny/prephenate dehydrogenase